MCRQRGSGIPGERRTRHSILDIKEVILGPMLFYDLSLMAMLSPAEVQVSVDNDFNGTKECKNKRLLPDQENNLTILQIISRKDPQISFKGKYYPGAHS